MQLITVPLAPFGSLWDDLKKLSANEVVAWCNSSPTTPFASVIRRGGCIGSWWGNQREGDHWRDLGIDEWVILGWIPGGGM